MVNIESRSKNALRDIKNVIDKKFRITPSNIYEFIYPLVLYIEQERPNFIWALDTGARVQAFAVIRLYAELFERLLTLDGLIHFRRISRKINQDKFTDLLKLDVQALLVATDSPTLFILDDWINTGKTLYFLKSKINELSKGRVHVSVGVMRDFLAKRTDVSGDTFSLAGSTWRNNPELIGVKYVDNTVPVAYRSYESRELRRQISVNIKDFVDNRDRL